MSDPFVVKNTKIEDIEKSVDKSMTGISEQLHEYIQTLKNELDTIVLGSHLTEQTEIHTDLISGYKSLSPDAKKLIDKEGAAGFKKVELRHQLLLLDGQVTSLIGAIKHYKMHVAASMGDKYPGESQTSTPDLED